MLFEGLSKLIKSKIRIKKGFSKVEKDEDSVCVLKKLEDIKLNFEDAKPILSLIDDQIEIIMKLKQGNNSHEDFIKLVRKELKACEKRRVFLMGKHTRGRTDQKGKFQVVRASRFH